MDAHSLHTITQRLLTAYDDGAVLSPITTDNDEFTVAMAYDVLARIEADRAARGWRPVGRKIGFTNVTIWERYGVAGPMWARVWDRTLHRAVGGVATIDLTPFVQPRLEPEVVFGLAAPLPVTDDPVAILGATEWIAAGFEIVQSHFPDWKFAAPDCTAAFGLHGALVVGDPLMVTSDNRKELSEKLASFTVTLACNGEERERGSGSNVLGSPALALGYLARTVAAQPQFDAPRAGEVITTGTLTDAWPMSAGEIWSTDYGSLAVDGLTVTFR